MSGHADYELFKMEIKNINIQEVPITRATEETLQGYGIIVQDFNTTQVITNTWPKLSGRPLDNNTGNQAHLTEGLFKFYYENEYCKANNESVPNGNYITGILPQNENIHNIITHIYTREANYHPDGGQVIYPKNKTPFILLLSKAGDNIKPSDFIGFYFNGDFGVQILPYVWHQPAYPLSKEAIFYNKQCSVHGCVTVDTVNEFNTLLKLNFKPYINIKDMSINTFGTTGLGESEPPKLYKSKL